MRKIILKFAVFFAFSLLAILYIVRSPTPPIEGDGHEYILMSQSYIMHNTPRLIDEDIIAVLKYVGKNESHFVKPTTGTDLSPYRNGYYESLNHKLYSYHFSFYSLINTPSLYLTNILNYEPTKSFYITNSIFLIAALLFLFFFMDAALKIRLLTVALLVTPTMLGYLKWPSPESFTSSLMIIAFVLFNNKRYSLSAFFLALASLQNQPVAFASFIVYATGFIINNKSLFTLKFKENVKYPKKVMMSVISGIPSAIIILIPSLFYYSNFGTPNLIATTGYADPEYVSISRFVSIFLDLNQGMVLLYPMLFVFLPILCVLLICKWKTIRDKVEVVHMMSLLLILFVCVVPCLSTSNWNSGAFNVMRYVYWLSMPLVFIMTSLVKMLSETKKFNWVIFSLASIAILYNIAQIQLKVFASSYLWNNHISEFLYFNKPDSYNPTPEVYVERSSGYDVPMPYIVNNIYYPAYVRDQELIKSISPIQTKLSSGLRSSEYDDTGLCIDAKSTKRTDRVVDGWIYHNYINGCKSIYGIHNPTVIGLPNTYLIAGEEIKFNSFAFTRDLGWGFPNNDLISNSAKTSNIIIALRKTSNPLRTNTLIFNGISSLDQSVEVLINGKKIKDLRLTNGLSEFTVEIPNEFIISKYSTLSFKWQSEDNTNTGSNRPSFFLKSFSLKN